MGYLNDLNSASDIARAFVYGDGIHQCPDCGAKLVLAPKEHLMNGVVCSLCKKAFTWKRWTQLGEKWQWEDNNTGLICFSGDEIDVEIPHHCTRICGQAFSNSNAVNVRVPDSVAVIEPFAFANNEHLKTVQLPAGLQRIEEGTFLECGKLTEVCIPETVKYIGKNAFAGCTSLKEVNIPEGVLVIGEGAFAGSGVNEIFLPSVKVVAENAFSACGSLRTAAVGAMEIGDRAFADCTNLRTVKLMDGIVAIGAQSFFNCSSLEHLRIPASISGFGNQAFARIPGLSVSVPKALEEHIYNYFACAPAYEEDDYNVFEESAELHYY